MERLQTLDSPSSLSSVGEPRGSSRGKPGKRWTAVPKYFFLILVSLFFLLPFLLMLCYSLLPDADAMSGLLFSPQGISFSAYEAVFSSQNYATYFGNSMLVGLITAVGIPISSSLCAYGFSKMKFKGQNIAFSMVLATLMIPSIVVQIPLYTLFVQLGWSDTLLPLWVPGLFGGGATNIFLMRQFMRGIPNDVTNAAKIDGANSFVVYSVIVMPLCVPIFLYVLVTAFIASWNDFMTPLMYVSGYPDKYTLSLGVYMDYGAGTSAALPNASMAAGVLMLLPCAVLFFLFQRYLIEGVTVTGLKG